MNWSGWQLGQKRDSPSSTPPPLFIYSDTITSSSSSSTNQKASLIPHFLKSCGWIIVERMISTRSEDALSMKFHLFSPPSSDDNDDDWLIFEILTRLPVKTLIRFKTVCKRWYSLIEKDENFIDSHLINRSKTSFRRLFIVNPVLEFTGKEYYDERDEIFYMNCWPVKEIYITADLMLFGDEDKGGGDTSVATNVVVVVVDTVREVDSSSYDYITSPVNGLVCQIESHDKYVVRICNISTRELSPWFQSSLLSEEIDRNGIPCYRMNNYHNAEPNYQFGFDPSTNEHKLVCVWKVSSNDHKHNCLICEVLTIGRQGMNGDNRWRRIEEEVPYIGIAKESVHVNGVIYWSSLHLHRGFWDSRYRPVRIVAFDVGREKFRTITIPDFILDQPVDDLILDQLGDDIEREFNPLNSDSYFTDYSERVNLLEVNGRLAMLVRMTDCMFKMYIYEDDNYKLEEEINKTSIGSGGSFSSDSNGRWTEASSVTLPFNLGEIILPSSEEEKEYCGVRFCKFVGSDDEIVLTSSEGQNCGKEVEKKECVSFYSYNWKKGSWREFEVRGNPSSFPHLCTKCFVTTFSESLLPVNNDKARS